MKKSRLFIAQLFLLIVVVIFSVVVNMIKKNEVLLTGTFGNVGQNTSFSDLADRLYGIFA